MNWSIFLEHKDFLSYLGLLIIIVAVYLIIGSWIKRTQMPTDQKRRALNRSRMLFFLLLTSSFFATWASEIYSLIISLTAIAAAMVIATKELLLCLGGSFYKAIARPFTVGDRIVMGELRGDVIEIGLFATKVLEVGPKDLTHQYTGRTVSVPNSLFLTEQIINETFSHEFTLHVFIVNIKNDALWTQHKELLLKSANQSCNIYVENARKHYKMLAEKRQLDPPYIEPRVNVRIQDSEEMQLIVRVTVPVRARGRIEQEILENYLHMRDQELNLQSFQSLEGK